MLGVLDLSLAAGAAQLAGDLVDRVPAADMALAQQAAGGVHGQFAAELDAPVLSPTGGFAGSAKAEALEHEQRQRRKGVIGIEAMDVLARDAGAAVNGEVALVGGGARAGVDRF